MDIKKVYLDKLKADIDRAYDTQLEKIQVIARMFGECMDNGGVVQLFGVRHGIEFVNELNYRAGGIAPFHALRLRDLVLMEKISQSDVDDGSIYEDIRDRNERPQVEPFAILPASDYPAMTASITKSLSKNGIVVEDESGWNCAMWILV